jgi:serine protease Do
MKKILSCILIMATLCLNTVPAFALNEKPLATVAPVKVEVQSKNPVEKIKKVSDVIEEVNKSVVAVIGKNTIYREQEEMFSKVPNNLQHGSGVVIGKDGRILTNNHVVDGLKDIYVVTYDGNVYKAELLYADKEIDLALLKINRTDLKPMKLANESKIKVGDDVIAVGTPLSFGYRNSASKGIVSGLDRPVDSMYNYLQTDAAINPGNSGGPLINMNSELVGINTLGYMFYQGMSFSIPVGNIKYFLNHYNKFGRIKRCFIGVEFEENWAAMLGIPSNQGLKVVTLQKGAVVTKAEVKEGDMLEAIDGKATTSIAHYNEILKARLPGDTVILTFSRGDKKFDVKVVLKERPIKESKDGEDK